MIPVTQTKLYRPEGHPEGRQRGNCQRAAMASLLEIGIDDMPPFEEEIGSGGFWHAISEWLKGRGLRLHDYGRKPPAGYCMAYGPSLRGVSHAVVCLDGEMVFDPHPSRDGLLEVRMYEGIVPL